MSKIDKIKRGLEENTEEWAKTANQVMREAVHGTRSGTQPCRGTQPTKESSVEESR